MKAVVSLSGGIDSAVTLAYALDENYEIYAFSFKYGSKHNELELEAAKTLAAYYRVVHNIVDLTGVFELFQSGLLKSSDLKIPEGHYKDDSMKSTVVPARNIIFISVLAGLAESIGAKQVFLGIHAGDHHIYPDCRPEFYYLMQITLWAGTATHIDLVAPFLHKTKIDIVKHGIELKVPFEFTRTCYTENEIACGKCGSCVERLEAFEANQNKDPVKYKE